jgi:hypothetical protein
LIAEGLVEVGPTMVRMMNWGRFQYESDNSTPRVKRFRNAHVTPPDHRVQSTEDLLRKSGEEDYTDCDFLHELEEFYTSLPVGVTTHVGNPGLYLQKCRDTGTLPPPFDLQKLRGGLEILSAHVREPMPKLLLPYAPLLPKLLVSTAVLEISLLRGEELYGRLRRFAGEVSGIAYDSGTLLTLIADHPVEFATVLRRSPSLDV